MVDLRSSKWAVFAASSALAIVSACANGGSAGDALGDSTQQGDGAPQQQQDPTQPSLSVPNPPPAGVSSSSSSSSGGSTSSSGGSTSSSGGSTSSSGASTSSSGGSTSSSGGSTSSSGGSTSSSSSSSSSSSGGACTKDAPSGLCSVSAQCGCASNQTCDVTDFTTGAESCILAGGGPQGSFCTTTTQCAKGMTCQGNACRPYCASPGSACAAAGTGVCYAPQTASGATTPNDDVCAIKCDVLSPASACGSNNCLWFSADKESDCRAAGAGALYDPCTTLVDCQQGLACVYNPVFGYECEHWCRIGQNDCSVFETCTDVYGANAPTSGAYKLGSCQ